MKTVSVAAAKNRLTELLREVERGGAVAVTRRGQAVAVIIGEGEYARLRSAAGGADFSAWLASWRSRVGSGFEGISPDELARWSSVE